MPFLFDFQNWLEAFLLFTSTLVIALAGIYSATRGETEGLVVEAILTTILVGSLLWAANYLYTHYQQELHKAAANKLKQVRSTLRRSGECCGIGRGPPAPRVP